MKWMGGWSYDDLCEAPPEYITEIITMIQEEAEERERVQSEMENR